MTKASMKRDTKPSVSRATGVEKPKSTRRDPASFTSRAKQNAPQCVAIKRNGERCKAAPIRGATVCRAHGGAAGHVKKKAKERLLELRDPALAELHRIVTNPDTEDSVKLRAIVAVLDRTGFARGVQISVETRAWDEAVTESIDLDRSGIQVGYGKRPAIDGGGDDDAMELEQKAYAAYKLAEDARSEAWAETDWDAEDAPPDHPYRDEHTVQGEVVDEQRGEPIPPGYYRDDEVRRAEGGPRRRR